MERITLDEELVKVAIPAAEKFWRFCVLPELLGKWYTRTQCPEVPSTSFRRQTEKEDSGAWCYCREDKGGEMIAWKVGMRLLCGHCFGHNQWVFRGAQTQA